MMVEDGVGGRQSAGGEQAALWGCVQLNQKLHAKSKPPAVCVHQSTDRRGLPGDQKLPRIPTA